MASNTLKLIKEFFSVDGKPVTTQELKELSSAQRHELADAVAAETGVEHRVTKPKS